MTNQEIKELIEKLEKYKAYLISKRIKNGN